ncbi:TorF family putative porin [Candidatus Vesicomyidisocius sp. SY067_SCS001]|uniref:TorF family putative porin n=1 Tax=Candidatus Vesicomyidisocius sp. SY067_SCS001 TaxID=2732590 RepID=UPI001EEE8FA5|nr:TorF family putative porin [Candidatus Vesicomyosocius sp. SY067_SCS001]
MSLSEAKIQSVVSANITIANDYVWRGKIQTNDNKFVQIGFNYDVVNSEVLGILSSNVINGAEVNYYISYLGEVVDIDYSYSEDTILTV